MAWGLVSLCVIRTAARVADWQSERTLWSAEWSHGSPARAALALRNDALANGDGDEAQRWCSQLSRLIRTPTQASFVARVCPGLSWESR